MQKYLASIVAILVTTIIITIVPVIAQDNDNLLNDPSFEFVGDYKVVESGENAVFAVPPAWNGWVTLTPRQEDWQNRMPNGFPHTGLFKIDGARSLSISRGFSTFTTAVYQTVTVPEDANLIGSARGFMERGNPTVDGGQFRVGIDPTGGSNPLSSSVIWSPWVTAEDGWQRARVDATAVGTRATLFLYATQTQPSDPNVIYWDNAVLRVGGEGGSGDPAATSVPAVPTPAFADFVAPQAPNPDGSIVHVVQPGNTLDAIAVAYGLTRDEILALNPSLGSGRFLVVGQELLVREATVSDSDEEDTDETGDTDSSEDDSENTDTSAGEPTATSDEDDEATATEAIQPTDVPTETAEDEPTEVVEDTTEPTDMPEPTATDVPPTVPPTEAPPAPVTEVAQVPVDVDATSLCVWMFSDVNQNRIQEADEPLLSDGSIVVNSGDTIVQTYMTDMNVDPFCFEDFPVGNYTVVAAAPDGYGLTTAQELSVRVQTGTQVDAKFGASEGFEQVVVPPVIDDESQQNDDELVANDATDDDPIANLLQISGLVLFALAGLVIVAGVGLALILRAR